GGESGRCPAGVQAGPMPNRRGFPMKLLSLAVLLFTLSAAAQAEHSDRVVVGGHVDIDDSVAGSVYAAGGHVTVDAPIEGGVRAAGGFVSIGPNALIERNASL